MFPQHTPPSQDVWIAFDLETTGLDANTDAIIEIGAIKFQGGRTMDTFRRFVNPRRRISPFISNLTGIRQNDLDRADPIERIAASFIAFVGASPLIAHTADFDLGFLRHNGIELTNPVVDIYDLAYVLRPDMPSYALASMAQDLQLAQDTPHRALDDATACMNVFLTLLKDAQKLDAMTLDAMQRLAQRSGWSLKYLLDGLAANQRATQAHGANNGKNIGINGLNIPQISAGLRTGGALRENERITRIDTHMVASMFSEGGALSKSLHGFEPRSEQAQMAQAVSDAINRGERIIVEAGTGVGKSLAYLLPAALYALANGKRIVISTNTINLQEQLLKKDVPILVKALKSVDNGGEELRFTPLKGRANYLCMRRWNTLNAAEAPTQSEARMLAKTMIWLQSTASGDRAEINLGHPTAAAPWERLSAQNARGCLRTESVCFLRSARERAAASHLVIVNHALLLSNATAGGALIPDYDVLIIDEAHHLEEEATKHLGFDLSQSSFDEHLQSLSGDGGLTNQANTAFRTAGIDESRRAAVRQTADEINALLPRLRQSMTQLFAMLNNIITSAAPNSRRNPAYEEKMRVTPTTRTQPNWSQLEIGWENTDLALAELNRLIADLTRTLDDLDDAGLLDYESLMNDIIATAQTNSDLRRQLKEFVVAPDTETIYWLTLSARRRELSLHASPLHVAEKLNELLFSQSRSVVMTSATLSADQTFDHIIERTGFKDADELLLGSPFDYPNAAVMCLPRDMPEPRSWAYQEALETAIKDAAIAADGRTMALFTSYTAIRQTANGIRDDLKTRGFEILQQGVNGPPAQVVRRFMQNPRAVLLGTASFWEGVDIPGDALSVLIVARLPFNVPTDPVFQARSELYDNAFMQYAVPQAILRLRQGFGRLIRTKTDRGVVVILDKRIIASRYGSAFIRSLPDARRAVDEQNRNCSLYELSDIIRSHLSSALTSPTREN